MRIQQSAAFPETKIGLRLLLRLFVRPSELRKGEWAEFDFEKAEWVVPAGRMKKREDFVVPLPWQALAELQELRARTGKKRWLFPNMRTPGTCMSPATFNNALHTIGYEGKFSSHGFRATASTILHGMGFSPDIIDFQLAHKERDETRASYNRYQWIKERRAMMQQWSDEMT